MKAGAVTSGHHMTVELIARRHLRWRGVVSSQGSKKRSLSRDNVRGNSICQAHRRGIRSNARWRYHHATCSLLREIEPVTDRCICRRIYGVVISNRGRLKDESVGNRPVNVHPIDVIMSHEDHVVFPVSIYAVPVSAAVVFHQSVFSVPVLCAPIFSAPILRA